VYEGALVEPSLKGVAGGKHFQFERVGFFYSDPKARPSLAPSD